MASLGITIDNICTVEHFYSERLQREQKYYSVETEHAAVNQSWPPTMTPSLDIFKQDILLKKSFWRILVRIPSSGWGWGRKSFEVRKRHHSNVESQTIDRDLKQWTLGMDKEFSRPAQDAFIAPSARSISFLTNRAFNGHSQCQVVAQLSGRVTSSRKLQHLHEFREPAW